MGRSERRVLHGKGKNFLERCFEAFSLPCPADGDCPVGPVTALADGLSPQPDQYWIRMDPVHLVPRQAELLLMDASYFPLDMAEAEALLGALAAHFSALGWQCHAARPERWYVRLPQPLSIRNTPLPLAVGQSVNEAMATGRDARRWHVLLNEAQMLLHEHPVNRVREEMGLPVINSVWFWGGGTLPTIPATPWQYLWSDDPLLQALARASAVPAANFPDEPSLWVRDLPEGTHLLVYSGPFDEGESFVRFEAQCVLPLTNALKQGRLDRLSVLAGVAEPDPNAPVLMLNRQESGRWWRRSKRFLATPTLGLPLSWSDLG